MYKLIRLEIQNLHIYQISASKIYELYWLCKLKSTLMLDFRGLNLHSKNIEFHKLSWFGGGDIIEKCIDFPFKFPISHFLARATFPMFRKKKVKFQILRGDFHYGAYRGPWKCFLCLFHLIFSTNVQSTLSTPA